MNEVTKWHFQSTSKEVIWLKNILNYMHRLKSAILAIFQRGLGWPCPVSAQKCIIAFETFFLFLGADEYLERLEGKIRKCLFFYVKLFWNNSVLWLVALEELKQEESIRHFRRRHTHAWSGSWKNRILGLFPFFQANSYQTH